MSRNITASMITAISGSQVDTTFYLVEIGFATTIYLTTSSKTITWNSNNYLPTTGIMSIGDITETTRVALSTTTLTLSGALLANISSALNEDSTDDSVIIRRAILSGGSVVSDPVIYFDGTIDSYVFESNHKTGKASVTWTLRNQFAQFEKVSGRRANHEENLEFYPSEKGFDHASEIVKDLNWGRV